MLVVIAAVGVLVVAPRVLSTDVPLAVVASYSMEPTMHVGDLILVNGAVKPVIGDVIVYVKPNGELIVHRLVDVRETLRGLEYITKGDANPGFDAPVPAYAAKGRVELVVPYLGTIRLIFQRLLDALRI